MNEKEIIEWLLSVLRWMRVLSHGEPCQKQDQAEKWLRSKDADITNVHVS